MSFVLFQRREQRKQEQLSNPHYLKMSAREERKVTARGLLFEGCIGESGPRSSVHTTKVKILPYRPTKLS